MCVFFYRKKAALATNNGHEVTNNKDILNFRLNIFVKIPYLKRMNSFLTGILLRFGLALNGLAGSGPSCPAPETSGAVLRSETRARGDGGPAGPVRSTHSDLRSHIL